MKSHLKLRVPGSAGLDRHASSSVPVFVNKIFRRGLAERPEPLRAIRRHPNEVARRDWIPVFSETIDAAAGKHQQAMFHDVDFDHRKSCARLVDHRVYGEVEGWVLGKKRADFERSISHERLGIDAAFRARKETGSRYAVERFVPFFDYHGARRAGCRQACAAI